MGAVWAVCERCGQRYSRQILLVLQQDDQGNPLDRWTGCPHCAEKEKALEQAEKNEPSGRSIPTQTCDPSCTDHACAVAWPDGSCGGRPQGRFYPPLFCPPKQSPAYRDRQVQGETISDAATLDFLDQYNVDIKGVPLIWQIFMGIGQRIRISSSRLLEGRNYRCRTIREIAQSDLAFGPSSVITDSQLLDWLDRTNSAGWAVLVYFTRAVPTGITLAYGRGSGGLPIRDAVRKAIMEIRTRQAC